MYQSFLSQLLILILIFTSSSRFIFIKNPRIDCFAVFSPCALIVATINIFCFQISILSTLLFILSLFVFLINFRSMLRLKANLFVDHYSTPFLVFTVISLLAALFLAIIAIKYRPIYINQKKLGFTKTEMLLTGKNISSSTIKTEFLNGQKTSGKLSIYEPVEKNQYKPVLIFSGTTLADFSRYEPLFAMLSQKGYPVMAADFYTSETRFFESSLQNSHLARRISTLHTKFSDAEGFKKYEKFEDSLAPSKYEVLSRLCLELFGDDRKFGYIVDCISFDSIYSVVEKFTENSMGFFSLNRIGEYETPGMGLIQQTEPLLATYMGFKAERSLFIPRYIALKVSEAFPSEEPLEEKQENSTEGETKDDAE